MVREIPVFQNASAAFPADCGSQAGPLYVFSVLEGRNENSPAFQGGIAYGQTSEVP
jgi:hypothetical protein